ncbi:MAG TPA: aspartate aminotransferase [Firmicutes bacterium]|nr:aspartate aminotransferase [Bacillota bacterium]
MNTILANRMSTVQRSFIREILKVTEDPEIISFAGGLPNPRFFPKAEIAEAAAKVLTDDGGAVLQYSTTEGYRPLREFIASRYKQKGIRVKPENILITNGSQQGLDLVGKVFLDTGDLMLLERPGYLGAIQAFSMFEPIFQGLSMAEDGVDLSQLASALKRQPKLFYAIPNFQNPSGISYSAHKRQAVAELIAKSDTVLVEDDPYGELRFMGEEFPLIHKYLAEADWDKSILLGSFSKIVAPGIRLGWICAANEIMDKLIIAKQASDLHSNFLAQRILYQYLLDNDLDGHIVRIRNAYKQQRDLMVQMIAKYFPAEVQYTKPEGGMFLWVTLLQYISTMELFEKALKEKVAFVPGEAFYTDGTGKNTLRLNFSNSDPEKISEGIKRLAQAIKS